MQTRKCLRVCYTVTAEQLHYSGLSRSLASLCAGVSNTARVLSLAVVISEASVGQCSIYWLSVGRNNLWFSTSLTFHCMAVSEVQRGTSLVLGDRRCHFRSLSSLVQLWNNTQILTDSLDTNCMHAHVCVQF